MFRKKGFKSYTKPASERGKLEKLEKNEFFDTLLLTNLEYQLLLLVVTLSVTVCLCFVFWGCLSFGVSNPFTFLGKVLPGSCNFYRSKKDTASCLNLFSGYPLQKLSEILGRQLDGQS